MVPAGGISGPSNLQGMRIPLVLRASLLAVLLVGWMAAPAIAAPTVISTSPEEGAEMHEPPGEVTIEFSEPLQGSSGLTVKDGCGSKVSEGDGRIVGTAMNELNVVIGDAPHRGTYTVEYVATGVTGTATGSYTFIVHGGSNCDGTGGGGSGGHHGGGHGDGDGDGDGTGGGNHGGHDGSGDGDHDGSGSHDGSGDGTHSGSGNHSGSNDHSGVSSSNHDMSKHGEHQDMNHKKKNRHAGHRNGGGNQGGSNPPVAIGQDGIASDIPTGTTVVISLGLATLMGVVGGWVLRMSTPS